MEASRFRQTLFALLFRNFFSSRVMKGGKALKMAYFRVFKADREVPRAGAEIGHDRVLGEAEAGDDFVGLLPGGALGRVELGRPLGRIVEAMMAAVTMLVDPTMAARIVAVGVIVRRLGGLGRSGFAGNEREGEHEGGAAHRLQPSADSAARSFARPSRQLNSPGSANM